MIEAQDRDRPIIGRDERERAHDAAEIQASASGAPGGQGNENATNRQDTQATTDAEVLEPVAQAGAPDNVGLGTPSQAEGERGATDVEAEEGIEPEPRH